MNYLEIFIFFSIIVYTQAVSEIDTKLVLLQQTVRHGIRTVSQNYPNDLNKAYWKKYGLGQLLPIGMKQLQDYGAYTMIRYGYFLNSTYSPARVFVRSTDYDRTLQSVAAFLSGAFKPSSFQKWTSDQGQSDWMPIPIHTNAKQTDNILHSDAPCPRFDQLQAKVFQGQDFLNRAKLNQPFIDMLKNQSGLEELDQYSLYTLADKFLVQETLGLPNERYLVENSKRILDLLVYSYNYDYADLEMASLSTGGLMNEIVNNMKEKISIQNPINSTRQYYLYSIHEPYVAAMYKILNPSKTDFFHPEFASGYIFELRNDTSGNFYVQVLLKNGKLTDPINIDPVQIEGCEVLCPLDKFINLVKESFVTDFNEACKEK